MTTATAPENSRRISGQSSVIPKAPREDEPPAVWPVWALKLRQDYEARIAQLEDEKHELEMSIVNQKQATKALSIYGPTSLEEMTQQVAISPRYKGLNEAEHRYVAGVGLSSGLNPEFYLHAIKDKSGRLTIVVDYKALIMTAYTRNIMTKDRRLTREEMLARGISEQDVNEGSIAFVVEGYELDLMIKARKAGLEYEPKRGYGWWAAKKDREIWEGPPGNRRKVGVERVPNDVPNGRDGEWQARKRAMRDLYNQFADLSLKTDKMLAGVNARRNEEGEFIFDPAYDVLEGTYTVGNAAPDDEPEPEVTEIPEWLRNPDSVARAEKFMADQGVTDEQVSAAFDVDNWREAPITPDEFKAAVELIKARQGEVIEGDFTDDAPETHQEAQHAQEGPDVVDSTTPPAKKEKKAGAAPKKCKACGIEDAVETPEGDELCDACAQAEANRQAARQ